MSDLVLECRDLHKRFGTTVAVEGVSLQVSAGETYGPEPNISLNATKHG